MLTQLFFQEKRASLRVYFKIFEKNGWDKISSSKLIHFRSNPPELFLEKSVIKICSKFTGEHPCQSVISLKLFCNFSEITLRHGCSLVNLLHIFRTPFPKNISGGLLLPIQSLKFINLSFVQNGNSLL